MLSRVKVEDDVSGAEQLVAHRTSLSPQMTALVTGSGEQWLISLLYEAVDVKRCGGRGCLLPIVRAKLFEHGQETTNNVA